MTSSEDLFIYAVASVVTEGGRGNCPLNPVHDESGDQHEHKSDEK